MPITDYFYYHCYGGCKARFRAENVNDLFVSELKKYVPKAALEPLYCRALSEVWREMTGEKNGEKEGLQIELRELENRLTHLRELVATQKLEPEDYMAMKGEIAPKIERLKSKLSGLEGPRVGIDGLLSQGVTNLFRIGEIYEEGGPDQKRAVIGSMFPEKLTFDGFLLRTGRVNEVARLLFNVGAGLEENKKGQKQEISLLSWEVTPSGFKPETY